MECRLIKHRDKLTFPLLSKLSMTETCLCQVITTNAVTEMCTALVKTNTNCVHQKGGRVSNSAIRGSNPIRLTDLACYMFFCVFLWKCTLCNRPVPQTSSLTRHLNEKPQMPTTVAVCVCVCVCARARACVCVWTCLCLWLSLKLFNFRLGHQRSPSSSSFQFQHTFRRRKWTTAFTAIDVHPTHSFFL
jgi:hypothetical protein